MSRLIMVRQDKGGVGKTFLAVHLTRYLRTLGYRFKPIDLNINEGLLTKFFPRPDGDHVTPSEIAVLEGSSRLPQLFESISAGQLCVIDCGPNTYFGWDAFQNRYPELQSRLVQAGVATTLIVPVTSDSKSQEMFVRYGAEFPIATRIMVRFRECEQEQFETPDHPPRLTIELPRAPGVLFHAYRQRLMTVDEIAESAEPRLMREALLAKSYAPRLHAEFERIREHLVP